MTHPLENPSLEEPVFDKKTRQWSVPEGYAYPKCPGCGHIFYEGIPHKKVDGHAATIGLCRWCYDEHEES